MKLVKAVMLALSLISACAAYAVEGTEGHGGDSVETLFLRAKKDAIRIVGAIDVDGIDALQIKSAYRNWLKKDDRLSMLQFYVSAMTLSFSDEPCITADEPRGLCYDNTDAKNPTVYVSRAANHDTSIKEAQALIIHEAGHFVGEKNHTFLSAMGVELVATQGLPARGEELEHAGVSKNMFAKEVIVNADGSVTLVEPRMEFNGWNRLILKIRSIGNKPNVWNAARQCPAHRPSCYLECYTNYQDEAGMGYLGKLFFIDEYNKRFQSQRLRYQDVSEAQFAQLCESFKFDPYKFNGGVFGEVGYHSPYDEVYSDANGICKAFGYTEWTRATYETYGGLRNLVAIGAEGELMQEVPWETSLSSRVNTYYTLITCK